MLYRHGDVLINSIPKIPAGATRLPHTTLAHGEITGHSHTINEPENVELFELDGTLYLRVIKPSSVVHQEHAPILLQPGVFKVWRQREYSPKEIRIVRD
jgi:hypothetical protein